MWSDALTVFNRGVVGVDKLSFHKLYCQGGFPWNTETHEHHSQKIIIITFRSREKQHELTSWIMSRSQNTCTCMLESRYRGMQQSNQCQTKLISQLNNKKLPQCYKKASFFNAKYYFSDFHSCTGFTEACECLLMKHLHSEERLW